VTDDLAGAQADLEQAETAAKRHHLTAEQARIHFLRGNLCFPRGDIDGCLQEHGVALELARRCGATELEAMALGGLGDAEYVRGRMISAHDRFRQCVELCEQHGFGRI
jgi:ATP/maltotriose-dependent transcriptional regulator MalT